MVDAAAFIISVALVGLYQAYIRWRLRRDPLHTVHAVNVIARHAWVDMVMSREGHGILAVQTLRNSVMASSFMASTAILLMVGTLTMGAGADHPGSLWHTLNVAGATDQAMVTWKLLLLLVDFFVAFFCFCIAVRFFSHVGYIVSLADRKSSAITPALVTAYLDRAGLFYLLGLRCFFYSVPLVLWAFGPQFMIVGTIILVGALYTLDRAPKPRLDRAQPPAHAAEAGRKIALP